MKKYVAAIALIMIVSSAFAQDKFDFSYTAQYKKTLDFKWTSSQLLEDLRTLSYHFDLGYTLQKKNNTLFFYTNQTGSPLTNMSAKTYGLNFTSTSNNFSSSLQLFSSFAPNQKDGLHMKLDIKTIF